MGKVEHPVPVKPQPSTQAVTARLQECRRQLAALEERRPAAALASARGELGAVERLAQLGQKIEAMRFEIDSSVKAEALASAEDREAMAAWMAQIQELPIEVLLSGILRDQCCMLCGPEGCVIVGGSPQSDGVCGHPVLERGPHPRYMSNLQVRTVYRAACQKLNVRPKA
jgi:hypothetical protein